MNDPILYAAILALIGGFFGFLQLARKMSGRIATTEAAKLWEEADRMRQEYREEIARLQEVVDRYEHRVVEVEKRNRELVTENQSLLTKVKEHEDTIHDLKQKVLSLSEENQKVRTEADEMRARVMGLEVDRGRP